jgi:hypothetical protein
MLPRDAAVQMGRGHVVTGDCVEVMAGMDEASVDARCDQG